MRTKLLEAMKSYFGEGLFITDSNDMSPYLEEERGLYHGRAIAIARPSNVEEVSALVRYCAEKKISIVPQGGNTGLCGGASPDESGDQLILSLSRLTQVREIDSRNFTMTVESGIVLQKIQDIADDAGCFFPLSLGAEGSCQIGGNIATNAGGTAVLRYGNMREQVLGLEVVLPDGQIWNGLRCLKKDNTGYDLKQLFIASEGTLGIITAAVLKLYPKPLDVQTAFCALSTLDSCLILLERARAKSGDQVTAFELIPRIGLDLVLRHQTGVTDPLSDRHDWYVLIELSSSCENSGLAETLSLILEESLEAGEIVDAVIATSLEQGHGLWRLRETIPEGQKREGASIKHDVSVPVASVPHFIRQASEAVLAYSKNIRVVPFGHVGDGNIHFNLTQPLGDDPKAFLAQWESFNRIVHDIVVSMNGSISAEHGIGKLKKEELAHYKSPVELALMQRIKKAIDPLNIMNPGKVI